MAADGGGGEDPFDFVLDETFVSGASVREAGWKEREAAKARQQKEWRKRGRKDRNRRRRRRALPVLGAIVLLAGASAVGFGLAGQGPLASLNDERPTAGSATTGARGATGTTLPGDGGGTTTSVLALATRHYTAGECIRWDQRKDKQGQRATDVVGCDEPHLLEMVGDLTTAAKFDRYPNEDEWKALIKVECGPLAEKYLGATLNPDGRYYLSVLRPFAEDWVRGERSLHCGLKQRAFVHIAEGELEPEFSGKVDPTAQEMLYPIGACISSEADGVVPCTDEHEFEVTANVDLAGRIADVPEDAGNEFWQPVLGSECTQLAEQYVGHPLVLPVRAYWWPLTRGSWLAGGHRAQCLLSEFDAGGVVLRTAPFKAA